MNPKNEPRYYVLDYLLEVEEKQSYINQLKWNKIPKEIRARVYDHVAGTIRMKRQMDYYIQEVYSKDKNTIEVPLLLLVRAAIFELLEKKQPTHAVVYEWVQVAKNKIGKRTTGFVNGILRGFLRNLPEIKEPSNLGVNYSHPEWLVNRWSKIWDRELVQSFLAYNNARPTFCLVVNTLNTTRQQVTEKLDLLGVQWQNGQNDKTLLVTNIQPIIASDLLSKGSCYVQDEAAFWVSRIVNPTIDKKILDTCAAPGGKTLSMAIQMNNKGAIVALDKFAHKTEKMKLLLHQQGIQNVNLETEDFLQFQRQEFDLILLDVPCTGTGVLSKRADLRWQRKESDLLQLVELQKQLLKKAADLLAKDGTLIYSTCSVESEENELQVFNFLKENPSFSVDSIEALVPQEYITSDGFYFSFPPISKRDGAFAARLKKNS